VTTGPLESRDVARAERVRRLLAEIDRREAMARAATSSVERHFGWSNLAPGSGLTEAQPEIATEAATTPIPRR